MFTCLIVFSFSLSLQDRSLVREVLETMIEFAEKFNIDDNTRVLALDSYTELLDLLDFMFLSGVLLRQAEILMNLVTTLIISYQKSLRSLNVLSLVVYLFKY